MFLPKCNEVNHCLVKHDPPNNIAYFAGKTKNMNDK